VLTAEQERLVLDAMPLMRNVIARRYRHLAEWDLDDLQQAGAVGLMQAAQRFDPSKGIRFTTFAMRRVLGECVDQIRAQLGRNREKLPMLREADVKTFEHEVDDDFVDAGTIATAIGTERNIEHQMETVERRLRQRLMGQKWRTRDMAVQRYIYHRTLRECAQRHGVTEARACQILQRLRIDVPAVLQSIIDDMVA